MAWQYEIANGDPLNKRWYAFCELANALRDRIILTDGDDTSAPSYTKPDASTTKTPAISDFVGEWQRNELLADNVDVFRAAILEANGNDVCSVVFADATYATAYTTTQSVLDAGSYGDTWRPHEEIHTPDYWAQMLEAMEKLRYCVWYLAFDGSFETLDVDTFTWHQVSGTDLNRHGHSGEDYTCSELEGPQNPATLSGAFSDYLANLPGTTEFNSADDPTGVVPLEVFAGFAMRHGIADCYGQISFPDVWCGNTGYIILLNSSFEAHYRSDVDYTTIFAKFYSRVKGTISASGASIYTYGTNSGDFEPNGMSITTTVRNDHIEQEVTKDSTDPEYLTADLGGAQITFGVLEIDNITSESQFNWPGGFLVNYGTMIRAVPAGGSVVSGTSIDVTNKNYYKSDLASELDYI